MPAKKKQPAAAKKLPTLGKTVRPVYVLLAILFVIALFSTLLVVKFMTYGRKTTIPVLEDLINSYLNPSYSPTSCPKHGDVPQSEYLIPYTVKSGDTLLSIANEALGDPSRANEIITLNKANYPEMSLEKPFIEVGWKLFLPPKDFPRTTGYIGKFHGIITATEDKAVNPDSWEVRSGDPPMYSPAYLTNISAGEFREKPKDAYKPGDCVTVIMYTGGGGSPMPGYIITPQ